jgi:hypothetical protein
MTRLYTLNISFKHKEYTALVSLRQQCNEVYCLVRYVDRGLEYLAPGDCLVFDMDGQLKMPGHFPEALCKTLNQCTADVVCKYLTVCKNNPAA